MMLSGLKFGQIHVDLRRQPAHTAAGDRLNFEGPDDANIVKVRGRARTVQKVFCAADESD